jgi:hypothetical protein
MSTRADMVTARLYPCVYDMHIAFCLPLLNTSLELCYSAIGAATSGITAAATTAHYCIVRYMHFFHTTMYTYLV